MQRSPLIRGMVAARWAVRSVVTGDYVVALCHVQDALDVKRFERLADRMVDDTISWSLMVQRVDLRECMESIDRWRQGSAATFGHQLARFYEGEATMDVEVPESPWPMSSQGRWSQERWRQTHDVRHVLLGLGTTPHEELLLHTFQLGQHFTWMGLLLLLPALILGTVKGGNPLAALLQMPRAYAAGRRAVLVAGQPIEALLDFPIGHVRDALGIRCIGSAYLGDGPFVPHRSTWPAT